MLLECEECMEYLINLPGVLIAIVCHEFAHGYMAYLLGDNTAKDQGRLTLNPIKHIDPMGFIFMLIFRFGWAKPVPINPNNFKKRKRDTFLVSIAGIGTNFILAILLAIVIVYFPIVNPYLNNIIIVTMMYNIMLGVFNILPFPPLDGSKMLASLLPRKIEYYFYKYERYLYIILIFLVATRWISRIMAPIINFIIGLIFNLVIF